MIRSNGGKEREREKNEKRALERKVKRRVTKGGKGEKEGIQPRERRVGLVPL